MVIKNLSLMIRKNVFLFSLLVITLFISVISIVFSYGILLNTQYSIVADGQKEKSFSITMKKKNINAESMKENLFKILESVPDNKNTEVQIIGKVSIPEAVEYEGFNIKRFRALAQFSYNNGEFGYGEFSDNFMKYTENGGFSKEILGSDKKVCILSHDLFKIFENEITLEGEKYTVIDHQRENTDNSPWVREAFIPFLALPDKMVIDEIYFFYDRPLIEKEYNALKNTVYGFYSNEQIKTSSFFVRNVDGTPTYKTTMFTAVLLALASSIAVCMIFSYLLDRRIKNTAIYRICGASSVKAALIYIKEMFVLLAGICLLADLLYTFVLEKKLTDYFEWFPMIYINNIETKLVLIYFAIIMVISSIMIFVWMKKTPKRLLIEVKKIAQ